MYAVYNDIFIHHLFEARFIILSGRDNHPFLIEQFGKKKAFLTGDFSCTKWQIPKVVWMITACVSTWLYYFIVNNFFSVSSSQIRDRQMYGADIKNSRPEKFGPQYRRNCICLVEGQVPCPAFEKLPKEMRGKYTPLSTRNKWRVAEEELLQLGQEETEEWESDGEREWKREEEKEWEREEDWVIHTDNNHWFTDCRKVVFSVLWSVLITTQ